jgi:pantoate--beta-alanine ligase
MEIFHSITALRKHLSPLRSPSKIGLVPTMGALHQGHLELVNAALKETDLVVTSIFVNPAQFNNPEDLANYPEMLEKDLALLENKGNHVVFAPSRSEMYPEESQMNIRFGTIEEELEGAFRPGHFAGVGLVVSKLFNIVQPDVSYFGQKDLQQFFVIKKLVDELNFPVQLRMIPTVREKSGLAMSSRNLRLNETQLTSAVLLYRSLTIAKHGLLDGDSVEQVKQEVEEAFEASKDLELEYFEVIDTNTFQSVDPIDTKETIALCIAAFCGDVRLIDNLLLIS